MLLTMAIGVPMHIAAYVGNVMFDWPGTAYGRASREGVNGPARGSSSKGTSEADRVRGRTMAELLTDEEIDTALAALEGWRRVGDALVRDIPITADSYDWMSQAVMNEADALNHHPEIERTGDGIRFRLWTHSAGGVTALDVELAAHIDQVVAGGARDRG
ncbi:4a-hydroxytetrahydrobiopterin dehydratase [Spongiactinospora sp. TRM90649]|uniref:4a-hydroxytetrahydrobiopterin dehydratase n=1 Tax=Spongiactinospora sp. TRM90649 TaxID=3031114 RepID=UPI0023F6D685|nr:4a-hydroxytetrahydrobiopterin dehydratase [Spongiactinospora sp. TRM90649]MDF5754667.1 4a-hydroxytetrahydrobiopterin dehydratase [Spongiactinospora sp. TRM90649]